MEMLLVDKDLWEFVKGKTTETDNPVKAKTVFAVIVMAVKPHIYVVILRSLSTAWEGSMG